MEKYVDIDLVELSSLRPKRGGVKPSPHLLVSIMKNGIKVPVVVRTIPNTLPAHYELVKGEAVWMAAQQARLSKIWINIEDTLSDVEVRGCIKDDHNQSIAVRNHLDEAEDFEYLHQCKNESKAEIARRFDLTRTDVSQTLRLLDLDPQVQDLIRANRLRYTHARILVTKNLSPELQYKMATAAIERDLSVKSFQALLNGDKEKPESGVRVKKCNRVKKDKDREIVKLEQALSEIVGCTIDIDHGHNGGGALTIQYDNLDILSGVLERLGYQA